MASRRSVLALSLVLVALIGIGHGGAASSYDVELEEESAVDVPDRSFSTQWGEVTISQMGRQVEGDTITVSTTAPDEVYDIRVVDSQERVLATQTASGDDTVTFTLSGRESGTYTVAITQEVDGDTVIRAAEPFVVRGFSLDVQAPGAVETGESFTVSTDVTRLQSAATNEEVKVVFGNASTTIERTATEQDGQYVAQLDPDEFAAGEYSLYVVVENGETYNGEEMLSGISTKQGITLEASTSDSSQTTASSGTSGSGGGGMPAQTTTSITTTTTTETTAVTTTQSTQTATSSPTTTTDTEPTTERGPTDDPGTTSPTGTDTDTDGTTAETTPGFTGPIALVGILLGSFVLLRRR